MNFLKHLFSYDFLFYINRVRLERVDKAFAALAVVALFLAVLLWLWARVDAHLVRKAVTQRVYRLLATFGLVGLLWFSMRYELVSWLGTHAAFLLLVISCLVWAGYIARYMLTHYAKDKQQWEHRQLKEKYLKMAA